MADLKLHGRLYRRSIKQYFEASSSRRSISILLLVVESGLFYAALWVRAMLTAQPDIVIEILLQAYFAILYAEYIHLWGETAFFWGGYFIPTISVSRCDSHESPCNLTDSAYRACTQHSLSCLLLHKALWWSAVRVIHWYLVQFNLLYHSSPRPWMDKRRETRVLVRLWEGPSIPSVRRSSSRMLPRSTV